MSLVYRFSYLVGKLRCRTWTHYQWHYNSWLSPLRWEIIDKHELWEDSPDPHPSVNAKNIHFLHIFLVQRHFLNDVHAWLSPSSYRYPLILSLIHQIRHETTGSALLKTFLNNVSWNADSSTDPSSSGLRIRLLISNCPPPPRVWVMLPKYLHAHRCNDCDRLRSSEFLPNSFETRESGGPWEFDLGDHLKRLSQWTRFRNMEVKINMFDHSLSFG